MAQYIDDAHGCRNAGIPLGGIGAGSFELRPDGYCYAWHLMNNRPWGSGPATACMERQGLRFAALCDDGGGWRFLNLGLHHGIDPSADGWYWLTDPYHLPWVTHPDTIEYRARFPLAELAYRFNDAPLEVSLEAWSPFTPGDAAASNTPGAVFSFTLRNRSAKPMRACLVSLVKNPVGYDHPNRPCIVRVIEEADFTALVMGRDGLPDGATSRGELVLALSGPAAAGCSHQRHPRTARDLWDPLQETGRLEGIDCAASDGAVGDAGATTAGNGPTGFQRHALAAHIDLVPGEVKEVHVLVAWHFPVFREQEQEVHPSAEQPDRCCGRQATDIGVQYAERFADALAVARWLHAGRADLRRRTRAFADGLRESSLPAWEIEAIAASLSVLLRSAWWDRAGRFGIWEGIGCCGLQTIDVGHYGSFPVLQFFPELDAAANRLSATNRLPDQQVPHLLRGNFSAVDSRLGVRGRIDLPAQYILAIWRYVRWTGDLAEGRCQWPVLKANLALLEGTDANGDGLPDNQGKDQTYDQFPIYGTGSFVSGLYLAALRAMTDLAGLLGEPAEPYRERSARLAPVFEAQLWNGAYYNLSHDPVAGKANTGCMTDQVNGDWFLRQSGGGALLDDTRTICALRSVIQHNQRSAGRAAWLANCSWPQGGEPTRISRRTSDQINTPWSGTEYAFAAHCALLGLREEARAIARDVWQRYETAGMRYNHVECGQYYYRWMSAWALYNAEFGLAWDAIERRLDLAPGGKDLRCIVAVPGACVMAEYQAFARSLVLKGLAGRFELRVLRLDGQPRTLPQPVVVEAGRRESINLK
jgi:uncharacterized protein (DUF608 family)